MCHALFLLVASSAVAIGGCTRAPSDDAAKTSGGGSPRATGVASPASTPSRETTGGSITVVPAEQRERVTVQPVTVANFRPTLQTTGTVAFDADISTPVIAPFSGPVIRILVQPGAYVHHGEALAIISSPDFAAAVAAFRKAQGAAMQTRRVADQDSALFKNDALARRDLEQAQTEALAAAADRDAAIQQLRALGVSDAAITQLREGKGAPTIEGAIRAPIGGTVVERLINPGQLLQAGTTQAFTIADLSTMWVMASVFEADLALVKVGDRADIVTGASRTPLTGTVSYIAALVDPSTKATAVRVVVPNTGRLLKKDMYVQVALHSSRDKQGILIPVASVLRDEDNLPFVFVELPAATPPGAIAGRAPSTAGRFARRQITIGSRVGDQFEVIAGLQAGERIIAEGGLFLQFAQSQ
ncbi:MAG: efflux RND transporter periplasmic adaptor subunit [Gemmatimonadota bacterium]|nr:efflux RND transporter periplasmic adaptor subunit [Gemmatimonadota bacterium]